MKTIVYTLFIALFSYPVWVSAQGVWTQKNNFLGTPRYDAIGYALNNKGYMGTGTHGGINSFLGDWQEFDPMSNTWTQKAPLPMAFTGGVGFVAGNVGYATCGANDATYIFETYEYNQIGNNWSSKAPFDNTRLKAAAIGSGNYGYIIGGYDFMAQPMNDCWEYNQPANTWAQKASLPVSAARYYASGFAANGKIYLFGGTDGNLLLNDLWEFNPATNTWVQKSSLPGAGRQQANTFVIGSTAYVVGGWGSTGAALKEVWKYNPVTDQWTALNDFPGANGPAGGIGFTIGGQGYVVCTNGTTECWEYTPATTGISDPKAAISVEVYPNPSSDLLHVRMADGVKAKMYLIINLSGRVMQTEVPFSSEPTELNISTLQPGFYILKIKTDAGDIINVRFIRS